MRGYGLIPKLLMAAGQPVQKLQLCLDDAGCWTLQANQLQPTSCGTFPDLMKP